MPDITISIGPMRYDVKKHFFKDLPRPGDPIQYDVTCRGYVTGFFQVQRDDAGALKIGRYEGERTDPNNAHSDAMNREIVKRVADAALEQGLLGSITLGGD